MSLLNSHSIKFHAFPSFSIKCWWGDNVRWQETNYHFGIIQHLISILKRWQDMCGNLERISSKKISPSVGLGTPVRSLQENWMLSRFAKFQKKYQTLEKWLLYSFSQGVLKRPFSESSCSFIGGSLVREGVRFRRHAFLVEPSRPNLESWNMKFFSFQARKCLTCFQ